MPFVIVETDELVVVVNRIDALSSGCWTVAFAHSSG